jgi:hypothetical protein
MSYNRLTLVAQFVSDIAECQNVILLEGILLNVILLKVMVLNVILLNVTFHECHFVKCHSAERLSNLMAGDSQLKFRINQLPVSAARWRHQSRSCFSILI